MEFSSSKFLKFSPAKLFAALTQTRSVEQRAVVNDEKKISTLRRAPHSHFKLDCRLVNTQSREHFFTHAIRKVKSTKNGSHTRSNN